MKKKYEKTNSIRFEKWINIYAHICKDSETL